MITLNKTLTQFSDAAIYSSLIHKTEKCFHDFSEVQKKYFHAVDVLRENLGEESVTKEKEAICQQIASVVLFSGFLGFQANMKYFMDPVAGNFLSTDPEIYLREKTSQIIPAYEAARKLREEFYASLNDRLKQVYEDIIEYVCYLETVGPKLSHFYGFLLGNELLPRVVPGYHPNMVLTQQYYLTLRNYFGADLDWNSLLKPTFAAKDSQMPTAMKVF